MLMGAFSGFYVVFITGSPWLGLLAAAVDAARETNGTVFLMQSTTMEELRSVCQAGEVMPQKSTYFDPKAPTGLVLSPLEW